jgi:hypothetical protein
MNRWFLWIFGVFVCLLVASPAKAGTYCDNGTLRYNTAGTPPVVSPEGYPIGCSPSIYTTIASRGYLIAVYEIFRYQSIISLKYGSFSTSVDLTQLPVRPDFVTAVAEARIGVSNGCSDLQISINGVGSSLTGLGPGDGGDCTQDSGNPRDDRTYTTGTVSADILSGITSIPVSLSFAYNGNESAAKADVRSLKLYFYTRTPPTGAGQIAAQLAGSAFNGLVLGQQSVRDLFGRYLVAIDHTEYSFQVNPATGVGTTSRLPTSAQQLYFYLPYNSAYESVLRYQQQSPSDAKLIMQGTRSNNATCSCGVFGNPAILTAVGLRSLSNIGGYLMATPRAPALVLTPASTSITAGSNLSLTVSMSGLDPGSLRVAVGAGSPTNLVSSTSTAWSDLLYRGQATLSIPVGGRAGQSVPLVFSARMVETGQTVSQSLVVTLR